MKPYNHSMSSSEDIDSHHSPSPNAQPAFPSSSHARAASQPKISPVGPLTLQTDIDKFREPSDAELVTETRGDSASFNFDDDDDDDDGFRSADEDEIEEEELEGKYYSNTAAGAGRSRSGLSSASGYTIEEERQVVKGFDRRLVPFLGLLYMLSFLDRSNIGNAKIAGLQEDLNLSSSQYEWLLTAFYITYILFEWMTMMYRLVPPHIYISLCVCAWGLAASFQSLATSFWTLAFLRAVLGIAEAAFGPGVPFYLSLFYKREELAFRIGLFISAAPLATSFASSLAWLIVRMSSDGPVAPWRTLFLVEGFPSVVVAVFAWVVVPDSPGTARFLSRRLRRVAEVRLHGGGGKGDGGGRGRGKKGKLDWREVGRTLADPKSYLTPLMFFSCNVAFSSMPVFLPTIINDMGFTPQTSQALSAPPYLLAFLTVLLTSHLSDKTHSRSPYLITHSLLSALSYLTIATTAHFHPSLPKPLHATLRYLCIYPAVSGFFASITLIMTWTLDNRPGVAGKGVSIAVLNAVGQCGPLLGVRLYPPRDGPWYVGGMLGCAGFMGVVAVLAGVLRVILGRENGRVNSSGGGGEGDGEMEMAAFGEREGLMGARGGGGESNGERVPRFTYML